MIEWKYLICSPTKNVLAVNSGIIRSVNKDNSNENEFTPNGLNTITISILDSCCLKCGYCSQSAPLGKSDFLTFEKISEILIDAYDLGARFLGIFGGEPMLHPEIEKIVKFAYRLGFMKVHIFTRATLINHEKAKGLRASGIDRIQVTVDSHIPYKYDKIVGVKGSFDKMFRGIYYLQDVGINIFLKTIITSDNILEVFDTILFFKDAGINDFGLEVVVPVGRADYNILPKHEDIIELKGKIEELCKTEKNLKINLSYMKYGKPKQCGGGIQSIFVFADGETGPCDKSHFIRKEISFGNIHNKSLKEIWSSKQKILFRRMRNDDYNCKICELADSCLGGCLLNSYIVNGEKGADPMCYKISGKKNILFPQI